MSDPRTVALLDEIARSQPGDLLERAYRARMLALLEDLAHPFARTSFVPGHITASAFVLSPDRHSLLLIHHRRLGRWLQPGGHVETSDVSVCAAAERELKEETGVEALLEQPEPFDLEVHRIPAHRDEPEHEHFDVRYVFRAGSPTLEPSDEVADARWVPMAALEHVETDASVRRVVDKLLRRAIAT